MGQKQLINLITQRVMAVINNKRPAQFTPSSGICTAGDKEVVSPQPSSREVLSGVITAKKIDDLKTS